MGNKRRTFSKEFKARVALEALKGVKTTAELASAHKIHPSQVTAWKKQLQSSAAELFESGGNPSGKNEEELTAPLYEEIGRLKMDIKWLEKKL